jgi:hypothetical protein
MILRETRGLFSHLKTLEKQKYRKEDANGSEKEANDLLQQAKRRAVEVEKFEKKREARENQVRATKDEFQLKISEAEVLKSEAGKQKTMDAHQRAKKFQLEAEAKDLLNLQLVEKKQKVARGKRKAKEDVRTTPNDKPTHPHTHTPTHPHTRTLIPLHTHPHTLTHVYWSNTRCSVHSPIRAAVALALCVPLPACVSVRRPLPLWCA